MTSETITDSQNGNHQADYQYDAVGNRTQSIINGVTTAYTYDVNDQLVSQGGETYTYDFNGSLRTHRIGFSTTTYTYNAKQQLIQVSKPGEQINYAYDVDGNRISSTENSNTTDYLVDTNRDFAQVLNEKVNNAIEIHYVHGDDLISQDSASNIRYYHTDGLGSTRHLSDAGGSLTDSYDYAAFGELLNSTGASENRYLFTGEQFDSFTGNYYLRARYYSPHSARFTQMDPFQGVNRIPVSLHKYLYANADPVNFTDPSGNFSLGGIGATLNTIGSIFNTVQIVVDVFQIASGEREFSARELGTAALLNRLPVKFLKNLFAKVCRINSFDGSTLVSVESGLVPISQIRIGDRVWAYNENNKEFSLEKVTHLIKGNGEKLIAEVTLSDGEVIYSTGDHLFLLEESRTWAMAKFLKSGDALFDAKDELVYVTDVELNHIDTTVYNITVNNYHNYFVGSSKVLTHNTNCFKINSRIKENPRLAKEAKKAGKDQKVQRDIDDLTAKLGEGNLNPGIGTKPIGKGISEARSRNGARVYFRVIQGQIEILGKSSKANQEVVIKEILKTF